MKKKLTNLQTGDKIVVGKNGETATVKYVGEIDTYAYHDAPSWAYVETEEFSVPFHFDYYGESVEVLSSHPGDNP